MNSELYYCGYEINPLGKFRLDFQNQYKNLKNIRNKFQEEFQLVYIIVLKTSETKIVKVTISRFCAKARRIAVISVLTVLIRKLSTVFEVSGSNGKSFSIYMY